MLHPPFLPEIARPVGHSFQIALCGLLLSACGLAYGEVVLVEDNRALCTVVKGEATGESRAFSLLRSDVTIGIQPSGVLEQAADDLAEYLNDMGWIGDTRHTVKVVRDIGQAKTKYRILLGTAAIEEYGLQEEAAELSYPGYIYRTLGNDLLIFGATSKGTANGVYGFLQDELGVGWFGPQELFTLVPRRDRVAVAGLDKRKEPSFTGQNMASWREHPLYFWHRRMRLAETGDAHKKRAIEPFSGSGHFLKDTVPAAEYYEEHPEYYRLRGGERRPPNLCWTNPEVIDIAVNAAKNRFQKGKYYTNFSLGIEDTDAYCECENCTELQPERYYRGRSRKLQRVASDMYFHFVNAVARRVKEDYPDRYIGLIAYNDVSAPPLGEIEDNVFVRLVLDISEHYDREVKEQDEELIEMWEEKGIPLGLGYYTGLAKLVPAYFPSHLSEFLKKIHQKGFKGLKVENTPGWWRAPLLYADARLWWDVDLDIDELLDEYFSRLYGPAAPQMQALYELFEEIHMRPRSGGFLFEHYNYEQFRQYTMEDFLQMQELIASAHEAIVEFGTDRLGRSNLEERRLAYTTNGLRLFMNMLEGVVLARELEREDYAVDDVDVLHALDKIDRLNVLLDSHERVYREAIIEDKYMHHRYTRDTATPVRDRWKKHLHSAIGSVLADFHAGRDGLDERVRAKVNAYVDQYASEPINRVAFMVVTGEAELEENLVTNGGFEVIDEDGKPEGWGQTAPDGSGSSTIDVVRAPEPGGKFGERVGRMKDISSSGFYLNPVKDVEPGNFYLCEVDAKLKLPEMKSGTRVFMRVQWYGRETGWIRGEHTYQTPLVALDEWESIKAVALAPEGAERAQVFLRAENMREGEELYWDNLSVRKIVTREPAR